MNQPDYERAVAYARSFLTQHLEEKSAEQFRGSGSIVVCCDEFEIPSTEKETSFEKRRRIFTASVGERNSNENGSTIGAYFLKIQMSSEKKERPLCVVIIGSKQPNSNTEHFQDLLGERTLFYSFDFTDLEKVLQALATVYGKAVHSRQVDQNSVL